MISTALKDKSIVLLIFILDIIIGFERNYIMILESSKSAVFCLIFHNSVYFSEEFIARFDVNVTVAVLNGSACK